MLFGFTEGIHEHNRGSDSTFKANCIVKWTLYLEEKDKDNKMSERILTPVSGWSKDLPQVRFYYGKIVHVRATRKRVNALFLFLTKTIKWGKKLYKKSVKWIKKINCIK